jgi:hypothetical protein
MSYENQSLSRRAIMAGAASVPVLALPAAVAAMPAADDTLARIERHRICCVKADEIINREDELESVIPDDRRKRRPISNKYSVCETDDPRWTAIQNEYWANEDEVDAIAWSFVERPPVSVAGSPSVSSV